MQVSSLRKVVRGMRYWVKGAVKEWWNEGKEMRG